jgi:HAMP domain-containing protein
MKLILKFNLVLLAVGAVGFAATAAVSYRMLQDKARAETLQNARLMMEAATATRSYTNTNIVHLLATQMKYTFLPESIPSFAATEVFNSLRTKLPDYTYKDAVLNPTNPRDRTTDWEADVVNQFRQKPGNTELVGVRDTPAGRSLYLARAITIKDANCLACHDTAATAPKTVIDRYGTSNGFGWKHNETVGAQIVSVPEQIHSDRAYATFVAFMTSMGAVFGAVFVTLNLMLTFLVIRPISRLSEIAERVSLGDATAPEFQAKGNDEIGGLGRAFARMRTSLQKAIDLIEQ